MKKITLVFMVFALCLSGEAQEVVISGYVDSTCPGAKGRTLEIYVNGTVDFEGWGVVRQANGGGYTTNIDLSSLGTLTDEFAYISNDLGVFEAEFDNIPIENSIQNSIISDNGDDGFQVIDNEGNVMDRFGEEGEQPTNGDNWYHEDTYYYRNNGMSANYGDFNPANWTFGAIGLLDGEGLCNGGTPFGDIVPFGSFQSATPSCDAPTDISISNITYISAKVSWVDDENSAWEVKIGGPNFNPNAEGETVSVEDEHEVTLENLTPDTGYEVYVRAICDLENDEYSFWQGPELFYTIGSGTASITETSFEMEEGYELGPINGQHGWGIDADLNSLAVIADEQASDGDWALKLKTDENNLIEEGIINGPVWNLSEAVPDDPDTYEVAVDIYVGTPTAGSGADMDFMVFDADANVTSRISFNNGNMLVLEMDNGQLQSSAQEAMSYDSFHTIGLHFDFVNSEIDYYLDEDLLYTGSFWGAQSIAAYAFLTNGKSVYYIDHIQNHLEPCQPPTAVSVDDVEDITAHVSWIPGENETKWKVVYGVSGFDIDNGEGTPIVINDGNPETTLYGLVPETDYDVYVRAVCDVNFVSDWSEQVSFTTDEMGVVSVDFNGFSYFPNPTKDYLNLSAHAPIQQIDVYNLLGQRVLHKNPHSSQIQLSTQQWSFGIYLMKIHINGTEKTFRVIKE